MDALLLLVPADRAQGHESAGDFTRDTDGRIRRGPGFVYTGAQIIDPDGIDAIPDPVFSLNRLWDSIGAAGRLFGVLHRGGWCDVGHPAGIVTAETMLANPPALLP